VKILWDGETQKSNCDLQGLIVSTLIGPLGKPGDVTNQTNLEVPTKNYLKQELIALPMQDRRAGNQPFSSQQPSQ